MKKLFATLIALLIFVSCSTNKKVRLVGVSMDAKVSSIIWTRDSSVIYLENIKWSGRNLNQKVVAIGEIDTTYVYPNTTFITESRKGRILTIKNAKIRRCFLCRVKKEEILDEALGKDNRQK